MLDDVGFCWFIFGFKTVTFELHQRRIALQALFLSSMVNLAGFKLFI